MMELEYHLNIPGQFLPQRHGGHRVFLFFLRVLCGSVVRMTDDEMFPSTY